MSTTVDERVVELQFDNKQFEKNVQTSMGTLDKLKQSLNFKSASKGLETLSDSAKKINMSNLSGAVETVHAKFSALEVMGVTALANITNQAVNAGKRLVSAFTIDPMKTGFNEFELKMGSVQTIMSSTGESLETVNQYLNELNTYSDKTIYSFSDMTSNIGKFTNAGVKLDDAVMAIKGISNEAALSGANANEASRAMYNFAQALSAGYVKLIDWKSIENANMATVSFKEQLLEAAVAAGTVEKTTDGMYKVLSTNANGETMDQAINATSNFNDSLAYQWMTTDVLVSTLKDYADETTDVGKKAYAAAQDVKTYSMMMDTLKEAAQSGWAQTWELIVGDFEEGKTLWTSLSEMFGSVIDSSADARNAYLGGALNSNWEKIIDQVSEAGIPVEDFQEKVKEMARDHGIAIDEMIEKQGSLAEVMASGEISGDIVTEAIKTMANAALGSVSATEKSAEGWSGLGEVVAKVVRGDFGSGQEQIDNLTEAGYDYNEVQELINKTYAAMGNSWGSYEEVMEAASGIIGENAEALSELSDEELENKGYTEDQIKALRKLAEEADKTGTPINELVNNLDQPGGRSLFIDSLMDSLKALGKVFGSIKKAWKGVFGESDSSKLYNIIDGFHTLTSGLLDKVNENAGKITRTFKGLFSIIDVIASFVKGAFSAAFKFIQSILGSLDIDIFGITASIGDALVSWKDWIKSNKLFEKGFSAIGKILKDGAAAIQNWFKQFKENPTISKWIENIQKQFNNLTDYLKTIFPNVSKFIDDFIKGFKDMSSAGEGLELGDRIKLFVENFTKYISDVKSRIEDLKTFLGNVRDNIVEFFDNIREKITSLFGGKKENFGKELSKSVKLDKEKFNDLLPGGLLEQAGATLEKFVEGIKKQLEHFNIGQLLALGGLFLIAKKIYDMVAKPIKVIGDLAFGVLGGMEDVLKAYNTNVKASALIKVAGAIAILVGSIALLTVLDPSRIWPSLLALGAIAAGLSGFVVILSKVKGADKIGTTVKSIGIGILLLIASLKAIEFLDEDKLGTSLVVLAGLIGGLSIMAIALSKFAPNMVKNSGSLIVMSIAIGFLVGAIQKLAEIHFDNNSDFIKTVSLLIGAFAGLTVLAAVCKGSLASSLKGSGLSILAMVMAIKLLVSIIDDIAAIDVNSITNNIGAFIAVFGMLAALMAAGSFLKNGNLSKSGVGILAMAASLLIIIQAIKQIAGVDAESLIKATGVISTLMVVISGIVFVSQYAGKYAIRAGLMLIMMSGAVAALSGIIALIGQLDGSSLAKGTAVVVALGLMMSAVIHASKSAGKVTGKIIVMGLVVAALATVIGILSKITDVDSVIGIAASLCGLALALTGSLLILGKVNKIDKSVLKQFVIMASIISALGLVVGLLDKLDLGSSIETASSLSLMIVALSTAMSILGKGIKSVNPTGLTTLLIGIGAVIGIFGVLVTVLGILVDKGVDLEKWIDKGTKIIEKVGIAIGKFVGGIISGFSESAMEGFGEGLESLSGGLNAFVSCLSGMEDGSFEGALSLTRSLVDLSKEIPQPSEMQMAYGGWQDFGTFGDDIEAYGNDLREFSSAVKNIKAEDISGALSVTEDLITMGGKIPQPSEIQSEYGNWQNYETFGDDIEAYGNDLREFVKHIAGIAYKSAAGALKITDDLVTTARKIPQPNEIQSKYGNWQDYGTIGPGIAKYGEYLRKFVVHIAGITYKSAAGALKITEDLITMGRKIPQPSEINSYYGNWQSYGDFGPDIETYGECLKEFIEHITGITYESAEGALQVTDELIELAHKIPQPEEVSIFQDWQDYTEFGDDVQYYGECLRNFIDAFDGLTVFDYLSMTGPISVSKALMELAENIPAKDSILAKLTGWGKSDTGDYEEFGDSIEAYGKSLSTFVEKVNGITIGDVDGATEITDKLISMAKELQGNGEEWDSTEKFYDLSGAAEVVDQIIRGISNGLADIDLGEVSKAVNKAKTAFDMLKEITSMTSSGTSGDGSTDTSMGSAMVSGIVSAINDAAPDIATAIDGMVASIIAALEGKQEELSTAVNNLMTSAFSNMSVGSEANSGAESSGGSLVSAFLKSITDSTGDIDAAASELMTSFSNAIGDQAGAALTDIQSMMSRMISAIRTYYNAFNSVGVLLMKNFLDAISASENGISSAVSEIMDAVTNSIQSNTGVVISMIQSMSSRSSSAIRTYYDSFYSAGVYLVQGFANGITANAYLAEAKARAMASSAANAAKKQLGEHSPSKVFYKIGDFAGQGFVNAMADRVKSAKDAGSKLADSAREGLHTSVSKISTLLDNGIDMSPKIRPILDLSDVRANAGRIDTMINPHRSIALAGNLSASTMSLKSIQNGNDGEVVSAIDRLEKSLGSRSGDTYNVNGVTYDDGSNISSAVKTLIRAARVERRS